MVTATPETPTPETPETRDPMAAYLDAVSDALTDAEIGVRCDAADVDTRTLSIDLEYLPDSRMPVMVWTPTTGWRVGISRHGKVAPLSIRYITGRVPAPAYVAESVAGWLTDAAALSDVQPGYRPGSRAELNKALANASYQGQEDGR